MIRYLHTPQKFKMEPANDGFQYESPLPSPGPVEFSPHLQGGETRVGRLATLSASRGFEATTCGSWLGFERCTPKRLTWNPGK